MKKTYAAVAAALLMQAGPALAQQMPFVDDFGDGVLSENRYSVRTSNENSSIIVDNGMLRLESVSDGSRPGRAALDLVDPTDFLQAELTLDGASMVEGSGMSRIMLSGVMYNSRRNGGIDGERSLGDVLVQLSLRLRGDGTLDNLVCAFRSNDADFGAIETIVIDGFTECGRFDTEVALGTPYTATIQLDRENRRLIFGLGDQVLEHDIRGNLFEPSDAAVSSVLAQVNGTGGVVAFADNVSTSVDAVEEEEPTVDEPVDEVVDEPTDGTEPPATDDTTDDMTGDMTDDTSGDGTTDESVDELPADDGTPDEIMFGNSGSGCSILGTSKSGDPLLPLLAALALLSLALRRLSAGRVS